jgi:hypothetical protein
MNTIRSAPNRRPSWNNQAIDGELQEYVRELWVADVMAFAAGAGRDEWLG